MMKQDKFFKSLVMVAAFVIAGAAAYFSIFGISKLFAGYAIAVIIMAGSLEFGKLIAVSYLQRFWKQSGILLRSYLLVGITVLMLITSAGIYGFLSNAYQETASKLTKTEQVVSTIDTKKNTCTYQIKQYSERVKNKTDRMKMLSELRTSQESRLDELYKTNNRNSQISIKSIELNIKQANDEVSKLDQEVMVINSKIDSLQDNISKLETTQIDAVDNETMGDLGPLIYISKLTGKSMDTVINWFILLIIFVFDPFAISLLIAYNQLNKKQDIKQNEEPSGESTDNKIDLEINEEPTNEISIPEKIKLWSDNIVPISKQSNTMSGMRPDGGISS